MSRMCALYAYPWFPPCLFAVFIIMKRGRLPGVQVLLQLILLEPLTRWLCWLQLAAVRQQHTTGVVAVGCRFPLRTPWRNT